MTGPIRSSRTKQRYTPMTLSPSPHDVSGPMGASVSVLSSLSSPVSAFQLAACDALSTTFLNSACFPFIVGQGIVDKVIKLLVAQEMSVRTAAAGALRNLTQTLGNNTGNDGKKILDEIVQADLITFVESVMNNLGRDEEGEKKLLVQVLAMLANLCETSEKTMSLVTKVLLHKVLEMFGANVSMEVVAEATNLLFVLTEENPELCTWIAEGNFMNVLSSLFATCPFASIKIGICGILSHIYGSTMTPDITAAVSDLLLSVLDQNPLEAAKFICSQTQAIITENESKLSSLENTEANKDDNVADSKSANDLQEEEMKDSDAIDVNEKVKLSPIDDSLIEPWLQPYFTWRQSTLCVLHALELLTNICSLNDTAKDLRDENWDQDANEESVGMANDTAADTVISPLFQALLSKQLISKLRALFYLLLNNELQTLETILPAQEYSESLYLFHNICSSSLAVLNNIVIILPCSLFSNFFHPQEVFEDLLRMSSVLVPIHDGLEAFAGEAVKNQDAELEMNSTSHCVLNLLSRVTALIWSLVRAVPNLVASKAQVNGFINLAKSGKIASVRLNCAGILSIISTSHMHDDYVFVLSSIFLYLLKDECLAVVAESLNALFDLFSEDGQFVDCIKQIQLSKILSEFLPFFTQRVTQFSIESSDKEFVSQLKETRLNLARFIKYLKRIYKF